MERSPFPLYLLFSDNSKPLERLRWRLVRESFAQEPSWVRRVGKAAFVLLWPLISAARAAKGVVSDGQELATLFHKSRLRVFFLQWSAAAWYSLPPEVFTMNARLIAKQPLAKRLILTNQERAYIVDALIKGRNLRELEDKSQFYDRCREDDLPCVKILYRFTGGTIQEVSPPSKQDETAFGLFAKPSGGQQGGGAMAWSSKGPNLYVNALGEIQSFEDILEFLRARSHTGATYLLQPRIVNEESIRDISPGVLSTVRIQTARYPSGKAVPLLAYLRMGARAGAITDNLSAGGLGAGIDMANGTLSSATYKHRPLLRLTHHPVTDRRIEGRTLPYWPEVIELALRAHEAFPEFALIGWDIALTPGGPRLIEGNQHPGVAEQFVAGIPLGATPFCAIAEEWLVTRQTT